MAAMTDSHAEFMHRLAALDKKHSALAQGYVTQIRGDGLIVVKPKRKRWSVSPRAALILFIAFFGFKAFMLSALGPITYDERVDRLAAGTPIEQGGAWVMQIDPLTQMISEYIGPILR